jgi:drug/metabolite transporter (DMT)-like permease
VTSDRSAIALATLAVLILTIMDAVIKQLSLHFNALEIMYFRTVSGVFCAACYFTLMRPGLPNIAQLKSHGLRSAIMLCTGLMFFHALGRMPLAELFVYTFTAPIFIALFGALILREKVTAPVIAGIAFGFSGILLIILTDPAATFGGGSPDGLAAAILSPISYALAMVLLRKQSGSEPVARIVFMQSLMISSVIVPVMIWSTPLPQGMDIARAAAIGVLGTVGNLLLATAFSRADAAKVAVSEYTGLIWAALIGYAFFAETPRLMVWAGAGFVIAGCLAVLRKQNVRPKLPAVAG